ncbi:UNKNOWN [Stylonychia lemnae]|uniref:EamA domain-containing protein n=1 Tax=Stylonychia lemnae TaxID=5949 RepID=A0A078B139_STYLE|nr:UNKNOWN [Stylonychia lemnae]|eukprot:CDW86818.1 UNKNOWN [Stylonychia lemnae]
MNKSTYSEIGRYNNYSQMIDPTSPLISKRKQKLKKSMFQQKPEESGHHVEYGKPFIKDQNDTGEFNRFQDVILDQKHDQEVQKRASKVHKHLQKSFEMQDKEKQCLQLSERGNLWIILALLAGICYAFNNFFLGQLSHHGFTAVIYVNIPSFCLFVVVYGVNLIRNKVIHGFFWCREVSIFFKEEDDTLDKSIVLGVCMMSLCKFFGFYMVVQTFNYATLAGMNLGIITVIFNFCCITDSIVFYFFFQEKLSKPQILGVSVLLLSAYFISLKSENDQFIYPYLSGETNQQYFLRVEKLNSEKNYNAMCAIFTALVCTLFFSARDVILRYYRINKNYPAFELSLDSLTLYSFGCSIYAVYYFLIMGQPFDIDSFYSGCMSAVLNTLGFMMLGISVVIGYAGPANALNSIQAIVLTMLSISILNHIPTRLQVIGMLLGMLGTIIVSTGDAIMKLIGLCFSKSTVSQQVENPDVYKRLNH